MTSYAEHVEALTAPSFTPGSATPADLGAHVRDQQAARTAAQAGDPGSFKAALSADQADSVRLSGTAQQFGATACLGS